MKSPTYVIRFADGTYYSSSSPWTGSPKDSATEMNHKNVTLIANKLRRFHKLQPTIEKVEKCKN